MAGTVKNFLLDLLFPLFCAGCGKEGQYLCPDCKSTLEILEYNYCLCDKNPVRVMPGSQNGKCGRCRDKKLSGLYFALSYKERALTKKLIRLFKYEPYVRDLAKTLAGVLTEHLILAQNNSEAIWRSSVLMPVPLERKKLKRRGYNQSEELAKEIGQAINVPTISENLVKITKTLSQTNLSAKERKENLKNVFLVKNLAEVTGRKVFLVDDVYTTGSTMEECAKTLKEAGAKSVWGLVLAREQ